MENLIKRGKVVRGWLGISIQPITPELAKEFNLKEDRGALVGDVTEESPAEKAGLRRGDVITEFNGREVDEPSNLINMVANTPPGGEVKLRRLRDGKPIPIRVPVAELPASMQKASGEYDNQLKGVNVRDIAPEARESLDIPKRISGVLIVDIEEGSPAEGILERNDVLLEVNKKRIHNVKDYEAAAKSIKPEQSVLVLVYRNGATSYLTLSPR